MKKATGVATLPDLVTRKLYTSKLSIFSDNLITIPLDYHNERQKVQWSLQEKELFLKNYLKTPKDFRAIANNISSKTTAECIQYYYLSKKSMNYKAMVKHFKPVEPLSKLDLPRRKAASKAVDKFKSDLGSRKVAAWGKNSNPANLKRESKLAKLTEVWIVADHDKNQPSNEPSQDVNNKLTCWKSKKKGIRHLKYLKDSRKVQQNVDSQSKNGPNRNDGPHSKVQNKQDSLTPR